MPRTTYQESKESAISSAKSKSLNLISGCLLTSAFRNGETGIFTFPCSFVHYIISMAMVNRYCARVTPWRNPAKISNSSAFPSRDKTLAVFLETFNCLNQVISQILSRRILLNDLWKSRKRWLTARRLWYFTPSINRLRAKTFDVVDLPDRNPFWLCPGCLSNIGLMRFRSMWLTSLAAVALRDMPL